MLWTDRKVFLTTAALTALDQEVPKILNNESLSLHGDGGILNQGICEASQRLRSISQSFLGGIGVSSIPAAHLAAVLGSGNIPRIPMSQVCLSSPWPGEWGIVYRWVAYQALLLLYREAAERRTADRYQVKYDRLWRELNVRYTPDLYSQGVPIVLSPLACPGAERESNAGVWDATDISTVVGVAAAQEYDLALTYTGSGYNNTWRGNCESGPSPAATYAVPVNRCLSISIARLVPPTGVQDPRTYYAGYLGPMAAAGWNVWAGERGGTLYLQNATPIPVATKTYQFTAAPVLSGKPLHEGQLPDQSLVVQCTLMRG